MTASVAEPIVADDANDAIAALRAWARPFAVLTGKRARAWRSLASFALAALAAIACLGALIYPQPARASLPEVGQEVREAIDVRLLRKIPLPPGRWRVAVAFEEEVSLDGGSGYRKSQPEHVLVLGNEDRRADLQVLVLQFTSSADVNWAGQPCDTRPANLPLRINTFDTTANSMHVRCNRVYAFDGFRAMVQRGNMGPTPWYSKRFGPFSARAEDFPVHGLFASAYLSAPRGDRVNITAYANPARHGLDGAGARSPFRNIDAQGEKAPALRAYLQGLAEWMDRYSQAVHARYLGGSGGVTDLQFAFVDPRLPAAAPPAPAVAMPAPTVAPAPTGAPTPALTAATPAMPGLPTAASPAAAAAGRPAAASKPPAVHALVIGNAAYKGAPLQNPGNDARAIAQRVRGFGFEVTTVLDATRRQMVDALTKFAETARQADVTIVFYAGHGLQLHGVNYLIPIDLDMVNAKALGLTYEAVSLNALLEDHLPGRARVVFLDACRDNPLARSLASTRGSAGGLAPMNAAAGTLISYATRDGSTAADGAGRNSPYTTALLAHLDDTEDISLVLRRVRQRVMDETNGGQQPWEYGSLVGDKLVLSQMARPR